MTSTMLTHASLNWGGMMEVLLSCEEYENCSEPTKKLKEKLDLLESSKTLKEIRKNFKLFSTKEIDYLNSPLLDGIAITIYGKHPLVEAMESKIYPVVEFYVKRRLSFEYQNVDAKKFLNSLPIEDAHKFIELFRKYYRFFTIGNIDDVGFGRLCYGKNDLLKFTISYLKEEYSNFYLEDRKDVEKLEEIFKDLCTYRHEKEFNILLKGPFSIEGLEHCGNFKKSWYSFSKEKDGKKEPLDLWNDMVHFPCGSGPNSCGCFENYLKEKEKLFKHL